MKNLIAIAGKKHSGKDEIYKTIQSLYHPKVTVERIAFADALKEEVAKACGVTTEYINAHKDNFRLILQGWGTNFRRELTSKDYWIHKFLLKLKISSADIVCVPDIRFKNEVDCIRQLGGYVICVYRSSTQDLTDKHPSEIELDDYRYDYTIYNNSDLSNLSLEVKKCIVQLTQMK